MRSFLSSMCISLVGEEKSVSRHATFAIRRKLPDIGSDWVRAFVRDSARETRPALVFGNLRMISVHRKSHRITSEGGNDSTLPLKPCARLALLNHAKLARETKRLSI